MSCDKTGNALTVWFSEPGTEYIAEETGDEIMLMEDSNGKIIGFEKRHFRVPEAEHAAVV